MRIASLLPSTTEIISALGLADQLVAVSHACDYPPEIAELPRATRAALPRTAAKGTAEQSDEPRGEATGSRTEGRLDLEASELGRWRLLTDILREASPELILLGDATGRGTAQAAVRAAVGEEIEATIVAFNPLSLEGIFNVITTIGAMTEAEDEAMGLVEMLREDLGELEELAVRRHDEGVRPHRAVVLEAVDPPFASSRWIPELVRRAGGWDVLGCEGETRESPTTWEEILEVDPEMLVLAPARLTLQQTIDAWRAMPKPEGLAELEAVRRGQVFAVEPVYLNRPGPRIVDGVALLGEILDPDGFVETSPPYSWTPLLD